MKCKVLILTHGKLAGSLYDTVKFIYGSTDGLAYLNMPEPFDQSAYGKMIADIVSENKEQGTLILCDLFGGSPFLTSARLLKENDDHMELVTGVNLGMLLELMANIESAGIKELKDTFGINASAVLIADTKEQNNETFARLNAVKRQRGEMLDVVTIYRPEEIEHIGDTLLEIIEGKYKG